MRWDLEALTIGVRFCNLPIVGFLFLDLNVNTCCGVLLGLRCRILYFLDNLYVFGLRRNLS